MIQQVSSIAFHSNDDAGLKGQGGGQRRGEGVALKTDPTIRRIQYFETLSLEMDGGNGGPLF